MPKLLSARTAAVVLSFVAAACGGGGTGGFDVSPGTLTFTAARGGAPPDPKEFRITVSDPRAAYLVSGWMDAEPSWLSMGDGYVDSSGSLNVPVWPHTTDLPEGTHTATLRVGIIDENESLLAYDDVTFKYTLREVLSALPSTLEFSSIAGGPAPVAQYVEVRGENLSWASSTDRTWLHVAPGSGTGTSTVSVTVDTAGLTAGIYDGTVTIAGTGGAPDAMVAVHLSVGAPALHAGAESLSFSSVNGRTIATQSLPVSMNNGAAVAWSATPNAGWITLDKTSGNTPDTLAVGIDPSNGPLPSGSRSSSITLTASYGGATLTQVVPVNLTLTRPTLLVSPTSLSTGGATGRSISPAEIQIALDTGENRYPWTATQDQPWMGFDALTGNAGGTPAAIHAVWNRSGLLGGTYTGNVHVTAAVNGDTVTADVPVHLDLDSHLLLADDDGVAFASLPGLSSLSRTLLVRDNFGGTTTWNASADRSWLTVTSSGTTPGDLVLTADPTGLSPDALHLATVTITSPDDAVDRPETIRVGLWVGSAAPATTMRLSTAFTELVADPIRPYVYVHAGGSSIAVYNVYTGTIVTTIWTAALPLGPMAVASDGSRLFALDRARGSVVRVNLSDLSQDLVQILYPGTSTRLAYARTNGQPLLITGAGGVFDGVTAAYRASLPGLGDHLAVSRGGERLAAGNEGSSPGSFSVYSLDFTSIAGGLTFVENVSWGSPGSNGQDLALDATGTRLYAAAGWPHSFAVFDVSRPRLAAMELPSLPGAAYPVSVEVADDGRIFAGADGSASSPVDVWIYDAAGALLGTIDVGGGLLPRQCKISGDGLRLVALTGGPALQFVTVAP